MSLVARTTHAVQLTDAGRALLVRARPAVEELRDAFDAAQGAADVKKGVLRITLPYGAFRLAIASKLAAFRTAYPEIEVELTFEEALVDLVERGFHAGVCLGDTIQQDMIAVRLTSPLMDAFFASRAYFAEHGQPREPRDLLNHNCIRYRYIKSQKFYGWRFKGSNDTYSVDVSGTLIVNSFEAAMEAAREGVGIAQNFREEIQADVDAGRLISILDEYALPRSGFFLYYPRAYSGLEILRLFIDAVRC